MITNWFVWEKFLKSQHDVRKENMKEEKSYEKCEET
jgi:hypothetical protein